MDLMKDINKLADEYVPPVEEKIEHPRKERLLKSMTPANVKQSDKLDLSKKKKTLQSKLKETREQNGWI